jgi:hypothetical protein
VTAFSMTNDDHVWLESGLEHDLLRKCDRDPDVEWLVSQAEMYECPIKC